MRTILCHFWTARQFVPNVELCVHSVYIFNNTRHVHLSPNLTVDGKRVSFWPIQGNIETVVLSIWSTYFVVRKQNNDANQWCKECMHTFSTLKCAKQTFGVNVISPSLIQNQSNVLHKAQCMPTFTVSVCSSQSILDSKKTPFLSINDNNKTTTTTNRNKQKCAHCFITYLLCYI